MSFRNMITYIFYIFLIKIFHVRNINLAFSCKIISYTTYVTYRFHSNILTYSHIFQNSLKLPQPKRVLAIIAFRNPAIKTQNPHKNIPNPMFTTQSAPNINPGFRDYYIIAAFCLTLLS